ncbi:MAG: SPFH domain-containing protein [Myxococcota bacterium]
MLVQVVRSVRLVPNQWAFVVERLGRYQGTMRAGFHAMLPFLDQVVAKLDLREDTIDVPPQECFTKDEVKVEVDGVMYISVVDPVKATYGITNYRFAATQLAQTTTRAVIGKLDLDQTFEERERISQKVVQVLEEAGATWGIRVHRYEIKNIQPPFTVQDAMEKQVTAERNRKAMVARAEGEKQSMINRAEGLKQEMINRSEGEMQKRVNEAEGKAAEILALARATAESIEKIAAAVEMEGGGKALKLQLVEKYLVQIRSLAREDAEVLLPIDLGNLEGMLKGLEVNGSLSMPVATSSSGGGGGSYTRRRPASPSAGVPSPSGSDLTLPSSPSRATFSPSSD